MSKVEALRRALMEVGDVPAEELAAFIGRQYGVKVDARIVPVLRATLKDKELLAGRRRAPSPAPDKEAA